VDRVNQNQGAESTLAFLLSLAEMQLMQNAVTVFSPPATEPRSLPDAHPLTPSLSPTGGEGARRAGEGEGRLMAPMRV